jgi:hypothetical protein
VKREHAQRVYYEQLKRVVPITALLERYGVLHTLKRRGKQLVGPCPIHGGRRKTQFVVDDRDKQLWRCFSPEHDSGGSILELVAEMEKVDVHAAAELIAQWFAIAPGRRVPQPRQRRRPMSGEKPSHKAFVVEDRGEGEEKNAFWTRIGSAWPHGDGKGLNIQIAPNIAVSGRVVLREYTEEEPSEEDKKAAAKKRK